MPVFGLAGSTRSVFQAVCANVYACIGVGGSLRFAQRLEPDSERVSVPESSLLPIQGELVQRLESIL